MTTNTCSKIVCLLFVFAANLQTAGAQECPWADTYPQVIAASNQAADDHYAYYQAPAGRQRPNLPPTTTGMRNNLPRTATGMPTPGTYMARANMALQLQNRESLPATTLDSFVLTSGKADNIYGMEDKVGNTDYAPIARGFDPISEWGLTTGQPSEAPSVWAYQTMGPR